MGWMATPEYQRHAQYPSFVGIGYGSRLHDAQCDVLVDGDSSALTSIDARLVSRATGLKTCNIAEVAGVKMVNGFLELDDYLAHNRPPRYLLFWFVPENLTDPSRWHEVASFEGWFYRLRYHRDADLLERMARNPESALVAAELGLRTGVQWLPRHPLPEELAAVRERRLGQLPEPGPPPARCEGPLSRRTPDAAWLRSLRERYARGQTQVLIDVAAEPACDPSVAFYRQHTGPGVTDNQLETLPLADYTDTGRLHASEAGAQVISGSIARQILMQQQTATLTGSH